MKINKSDLLKKLVLIKPAISKNSVLPILSTIRFTAKDNIYNITASNLTFELSVSGECDGDDMSVCVNPSMLSAMVESSGDIVNLSIKNNKLISKGGKSNFNLAYQEGEEFPSIQSEVDKFNDVNLREVMAGLYTVAPKNDIRYYLVGVCIQSTGKNINAVATDGSLFARKYIEKESDQFNFILPLPVSEYLSSIDINGFHVDNKTFSAFNEDLCLRITSKIVDGKFPDWKRIMNPGGLYSGIKSNEIIDALKLSKQVSQTGSVKVTSKDGFMSLSVEENNNKVTSDIAYEGDDLNCSFNCDLFLKAISLSGDDNIKLTFDGDVRMIEHTSGNFTFILAPLRV